jgi:hypothetical protein
MQNNKFKCYNCGKPFKDNAHLQAHKNRKTPCLIREVPPDQINNPNRCIFCNKIFSKKENLTRHLKTCKVKNGGMDILVDKVKYDQEIRILKEQMDQKDKIRDQKDKEKDEQIQLLLKLQQAQSAEIEALKKAIVPNSQSIAQTPHNTINNNNTIIINNITINNYTTPLIKDNLKITSGELDNISKLSKHILQKLYFNPELPENHCIYLQNKKDKSLIVHDDNSWRSVTGENIKDVIDKLNSVVSGGPGFQLIYDLVTGPELPIVSSNKIADLTASGLDRNDAYEVFLAGRDVVLGTIRAAGCKLIS